MTADILTVARKELKELLAAGPGLRGGKASLLVLLAVFGVLLPAQSGVEWLRSPGLLAMWSWVPLMLVSSVVADSFAGERERHTLETLLASRLPDGAILLGKVTAAVAYAWGITLAMAAVSFVTVNAMYWQGRITWVPVQTAVGLPVLSALTALLAALAGVLISLRAATARQAAQTLSIGVMLVLFVPLFGFRALPAAWQARALSTVQGVDPLAALTSLVAILLLADGVLLAAGMLRFRRARLILD